jgi:hypothetical protein
VSVGFGIVLPLLPDLIEQLLGVGAEAAQVSRHTGFLTGCHCACGQVCWLSIHLAPVVGAILMSASTMIVATNAQTDSLNAAP